MTKNKVKFYYGAISVPNKAWPNISIWVVAYCKKLGPKTWTPMTGYPEYCTFDEADRAAKELADRQVNSAYVNMR